MYVNVVAFKSLFLKFLDHDNKMNPDSIIFEDGGMVEMEIPMENDPGAESSEPILEELLLGGNLVEVPSDLYENEDIFNTFFSVETWNNLIPEDVKLELLQYLPNFPTDDLDEKARTIEMLFGGQNFHFGNPLEKFREDLVNGDYLPENVEMKAMVATAQRRNFEEWLENYQFDIAQKCLDSRKKHLEAATGNIVTVPKIDRKHGGAKGGNMQEKISKRYMEEISRIKREIGEDGFSSDDEEFFNPKIPQYIPAKEPEETLYHQNGHLEELQLEEIGDNHIDAGVHAPLTQDMQPCFFSLLRDLFHQVNWEI